MSNKFTTVTIDVRTWNKEQSSKFCELLTEFLNNGVKLTVDNASDVDSFAEVNSKRTSQYQLEDKLVKELDGKLPQPAAAAIAKTYITFRKLNTSFVFPDSNAVEFAKAIESLRRTKKTSEMNSNEIILEGVRTVIIPHVEEDRHFDVVSVVERLLLRSND